MVYIYIHTICFIYTYIYIYHPSPTPFPHSHRVGKATRQARRSTSWKSLTRGKHWRQGSAGSDAVWQGQPVVKPIWGFHKWGYDQLDGL